MAARRHLWFVGLLCAVTMQPASGQSSLDESVPSLMPEMFFDARQTRFSRDGHSQIFEGDVVAIGAAVLISADYLSIDRKGGVLLAKGHVVIIASDQVFTGSEVRYLLSSTDFEVADAVMVANDEMAAERVTRQLLGMSNEELAFESERADHLSQIDVEKGKLRQEYRLSSHREPLPSPDLVDHYSLLLEREYLIRNQENPSLSRLSEPVRDRIKRRRAFWKKSRRDKSLISDGDIANKSYFRLEGERITRTNGNDYRAYTAVWTPCHCEEDESPDWGFRAEQVDAQMEGYADLQHPVLEIKGIPVLYLPYLKVPIKEKRQSGFLLPTLNHSSRSGNIFTQPVYFDFAPHFDSTLTTDVYEKRGTRLGWEYRYQETRSAGWYLNLEGIRDRLWLRDRGQRDQLQHLYVSGMEAARSDPGSGYIPTEVGPGISDTRDALRKEPYWSSVGLGACVGAEGEERDDCEARVRRHLVVPRNTWRGAVNWKGQTYFAPRLSLATSGEVTTDHRYAEDLYVPTDLQEAFNRRRMASAYSPTKARLHLDAKKYYLGVGSSMGDNVLTDEQFFGHQIPAYVTAKSRWFSLNPKEFLSIPIYGEVSVERYQISSIGAEGFVDPSHISPLGNGSWERGMFKYVSPWLSRSIVQMDHFSEFEARQITHGGYEDSSSHIRSWRTGVSFQLPIDGQGPLPAWMQKDESGETKRHLHHLMNWSLTFSLRPMVERHGPYGVPELGGENTYFASDAFAANPTDETVEPREVMQTHREVTLGTSHVWETFDRGWKMIPGKTPKREGDTSLMKETFAQQAMRELRYSRDRPVKDSSEMFDSQDWYVNRYQEVNMGRDVPVTFSASVTYDFLRAEEREEQSKDPSISEENLPQAWHPVHASLTLKYGGYRLNNQVQYNIYEHMPNKMTFSLGLPTYFGTSMSFGYVISQSLNQDTDEFNREIEQSAQIKSRIIPRVQMYSAISRKLSQEEYHRRYSHSLGIEYEARSRCWRLGFQRSKDYDNEEKNASYLLVLQIEFLGQTRPLGGDLSRGLRREFLDSDEES